MIITGQTGAGKSILLGALGLLAGDKADATLISQGAETCVVEGEFDTPDGLRIIRRVLYSSGRSRSFIDDCPVQLQELAELSGRLFDIHSQHQSLLLSDRQFQLNLLDNYAGATGAAAECAGAWERLTRCRGKLRAAREELARLQGESGYNAAQFAELQAAALRDGELEELEEEQLTLGNAEEILERLGTARDLMYGAAGTPINDLLQQARKSLEYAGRYLPDVQELVDRIESARIELDDILSEIDSTAGNIESSPHRLEQVEQRLGLLYRLMTKHGCNSVAGLIEARERFGKAVEGTSDLSDECEELEKEAKRLEAEHAAACARLHEMRDEARVRFAAEVTENLHYLEMERASFSVGLNPAAPGATGSDSVTFLFSADGMASTEVAKCASGGELSRIMLSLKALMARFKGMPTLIFDEIDAGVSGSVAAKMGQMICGMAQTMQVFSITHLPQVAAKGTAHYVVSKTFDPQSGRTTSGIARVEGAEREREIARLLSGESITAEALANARALMEE